MVLNESYDNESDEHPAVNELKSNLKKLIVRDSVCVLFVNAASNENLMQFNVGAEKGDHSFESGSFFSNKKRLDRLFSKAETLGLKYNMKVLKHGTVGNPGQNHISNFIAKELNCDLLMLHVNVGILKKNGKEYYQFMEEFAGILSLD
jgi:hypothetical protein